MSQIDDSARTHEIDGVPDDSHITSFLAGFGRSISIDEIPDSVVEGVKRCFLDWLGVALTGSGSEVAKIIRNVSLRGVGTGHAGVIGGEYPGVGPVEAALINGTTAHALDYDDGLEDPELVFGLVVHPSGPIMAAALALAQSENASGKSFLEAVFTAQETMVRIVGYTGLSHQLAGWHATGTMGGFAAAAAGAKLLDLDEERWKMALGIAGTQTAGLRAMFGTMCKPFHSGKAASNGVLAALLANEGFTSSANVLEARYGFGWTQSTELHPDRMVRPLGPPYFAERINFKMFASCGGTQCSIQAMSRLKNENALAPADIDRITIRVPEPRTTSCNIQNPQSALEGKFSLRYTATAALLGWDTTGPCFTDAAVTSPEAVEVMKRITVEGIDLPTVVGPTEIEVVLKDGRRLVCKLEDAERGGPSGWDGVTEKYLRLAIPVVGEELATNMLNTIINLEDLESMRWFHTGMQSMVLD